MHILKKRSNRRQAVPWHSQTVIFVALSCATRLVVAPVIWLQYDKAASNDDGGEMSVETVYQSISVSIESCFMATRPRKQQVEEQSNSILHGL